MDGYLSSMKEEREPKQPKKKKPRGVSKKKDRLPTENELKYRSLADAYGAWEESLKDKLYKSEICLCRAIIMKYCKQDSFPDEDADQNPEHLRLSREGWKLFRASREFAAKHPDSVNQMKINGEWAMV